MPPDEKVYTAESLQLARFEEQLSETRRQVTSMADEIRELHKVIGALNEQLQQARGGWRTLMAASGLIGALAGAGSFLATHVRYSP